jgi:hypothetical protein
MPKIDATAVIKATNQLNYLDICIFVNSMIGRESRSRINKIQKSRLKYILIRETPGKGANSGDSGFSWAQRYARQKNIFDLPVNFRCFENWLGICSDEHEPDSSPKTLAYPFTATEATQAYPAT